MEALMSLAMVAGRLLADEKDQTGVRSRSSLVYFVCIEEQQVWLTDFIMVSRLQG